MDFPRGTVQEHSIYSNKLKEQVDFLIYLPANFSPLYKYHVLIAQDGADYFRLGRITSFADELLYKNEIERVIIVGVPYKNAKDRYEKYHPDGSKHGAYLQFLAQELVPFLDQHFPTYEIGLGRALIGDSLAGYASIMAALRFPNTFGKAALQSPYVHGTLLAEVKKLQSPPALEIYHVVGKDETSVKTTKGKLENFIEPNRELSSLFKQKGFDYFYSEFAGDHTWTHWQPDVKRALKYLFKKES
jgi:enterochelin esterase-like enzyme